MSEAPTTIYVQWSDDGQYIRKWSHETFDGGTAFVASDTITALRAEIAEAHETIIAFAGPWATQYARDFGLPDGHLHPTHYDILAKAGARMDSFTRAALTQTKDTTDDA